MHGCHVMRREEHYAGRMAMEMKVQGRKKIVRPKRRWLDKVKDDIKEKGLSADEVYDRATWRRKCHRTSILHKSGNTSKTKKHNLMGNYNMKHQIKYTHNTYR